MSALMACEWARIDRLANCLLESRRGQPMDDKKVEELVQIQKQVDAVRDDTLWGGIISRYGLERLDTDILAFTLAPDVEPRLGWMFQTLQSGVSSAYPSAALICEMLGMEQIGVFHQRLDGRAPLLRHGLIESAEGGVYAPLRATSKTRSELLGWKASRAAPKGAMEVPVIGTIEDLVLPQNCLQVLREYLMWIHCRDVVVGQWGAKSSGGPVALFSGPSGTGKSYAAEALAHALGWPLYRVDLGLLVSKYIGETEKNLNMLFDSTHGEPMVLLFDEADALFGKRGEVKEARDRYANMEVSHLLTRMECHQGPCILTTNLRDAIDSAFARRFHAVVDFPRPDAKARCQLWKQHIPPKAPLASEVDFQMLGKAVILTGGQIRNAALHAAYIAAGEGGEVDLRRIARSVWAELGKDGRERVKRSLGELVNHLPEVA
ncbi:MAG: ATP-binding protein [Proteobacteria bacterium]|nr:ATP-binding protein [Cystobacterineae bacterium]MCL2314762.1 ATP-binding protein [Pseudomonadota bacterium]